MNLMPGRLSRVSHGIVTRDTRVTGWETFEDYCREQWGMSRIHAHRMIEAAYVTNNLLPIGNILPMTESQARPLASLEPAEQAEAWKLAVKTLEGTAVRFPPKVQESERMTLNCMNFVRLSKIS